MLGSLRMVLTVSMPVAPWLSTTAILAWSWNAFYSKFLRSKIMFTWSMLLRKRNCLAITTSTTVTYTSTRPWKHKLVTRELRLQSVMSWLLLNQSFYIKEL